jgi:hypothetical protein
LDIKQAGVGTHDLIGGMFFPGMRGKNTRFFYRAEYPSTGQQLRNGSRWFDPLPDPER